MLATVDARDADLVGNTTVVLIGLGGNLPSPAYGPPRRTLAAALAVLADDGISVAARSAWYRSAPLPASDQPWYVNAVAALATKLDPFALLAALQQVERRFGRVRGAPNAARTVDLDLLDYNGVEVDTAVLVLPHPRLHQRRFVLAPLAELAPDWRHPRYRLTAAQLLARLTTPQPVYRLPLAPDDRPDGSH
jgi:2-amino-4-hydroxy-6-hydroxymethyldihydropteridine diphosphokinase